MRLRRVRAPGDPEPSVAVLDAERGGWVALAPALGRGASDALRAGARDLVAFLGGGDAVREEARGVLARAEHVEHDPEPLLPFTPRSFRDFSVFPRHLEQSARVLARRFFPAPMGMAVGAFEAVTRRTFPALKPKKRFYEEPSFYVGNHTAFLADGEEIPWPRHTDYLDYELELGFVLARDAADTSPEEGTAAIGGFCLVNDWSARDVQAEEYRHGLFGPAVKSKTFNNSLGPVVVTADEVLPRLDSLEATVTVNGETWSRGSTAGAAHSPGELVAYASRGERLGAGDLIATGTVPNCCGLELDRWLSPGDVVTLELELMGTLTNRVGRRGGEPELNRTSRIAPS